MGYPVAYRGAAARSVAAGLSDDALAAAFQALGKAVKIAVPATAIVYSAWWYFQQQNSLATADSIPQGFVLAQLCNPPLLPCAGSTLWQFVGGGVQFRGAGVPPYTCLGCQAGSIGGSIPATGAAYIYTQSIAKAPDYPITRYYSAAYWQRAGTPAVVGPRVIPYAPPRTWPQAPPYIPDWPYAPGGLQPVRPPIARPVARPVVIVGNPAIAWTPVNTPARDNKVKASPGMVGAIGYVLSQFSEFNDFVDVLLHSMDKQTQKRLAKERKGNDNFAVRQNQVLDNLDAIDASAFLVNFMINQLEDAIIGRAFSSPFANNIQRVLETLQHFQRSK